MSQPPSQARDDRWCPSARPEQPGAIAFGVRVGEEAGARIGYLSELVPVDDELLALAEPATPLEVFRFGAPCAQRGCAHFRSGKCTLVERIVESVPIAVSIAPACSLRSRCKWWDQEGVAACLRCPAVVTSESGAKAELAAAAEPPRHLSPS